MYRRLPAVLRVANVEALQYLPHLNEADAYAAVRFWTAPERRRLLAKPLGRDQPYHLRAMQDWVLLPVCRDLRSWWGKPEAWRSPREFVGYHGSMANLGLPRVEPYEVAHFRLPDDISCDADVVLFQAWCQGWSHKAWQRGLKRVEGQEPNPLAVNHPSSIRRGLQKFCRSPYVRFALASPFMNGAGIQFPGHSLYDSALRMEYLVKNSFMATDAELAEIHSSPVFQVAFRNARAARKAAEDRGGVINPDGGWYVGGSIRAALGSQFRRGGLQPARGKK